MSSATAFPAPSAPTAESRLAPDALVGALFDAHAGFLLRVVRRLTGPGPHVEDLVQETFLVAHRKRQEVAASDEPRAWLYRTATYLVKHHFRSRGRWAGLLARLGRREEKWQAPADEDLVRVERARRVHRCLAALPWKQREVLVLYEMEGLGVERIAELLAISQNTVWSRIRLGRRHFRAVWTRAAPEGDHR